MLMFPAHLQSASSHRLVLYLAEHHHLQQVMALALLYPHRLFRLFLLASASRSAQDWRNLRSPFQTLRIQVLLQTTRFSFLDQVIKF